MTPSSRTAPGSPEAGWQAVATLYHACFTGLILTVASRRGAGDAGRWMEAVFRHQHHEKFLSSFDKLGLTGLPPAVAAAGYHYLANRIGGVDVEFASESDRKAWVRFVPPRWVYPGAAICGVPSEVSRGMLRGWYAENGPSLGNPRLGFVCTAQTMDGQHGLAGYFLEHDRELTPGERLVFRPGELPPPCDPDAAPKLPEGEWPAERLAKAARNYAMEYVRTGLPRLVELFGPAEARHLGNVTGRLIGAQYALDMAARLGVENTGAEGFARVMAGLAEAEGDAAAVEREGDAWLVLRRGWRLARGLGVLDDAVFDAWNGLNEGMVAVHDRFLALDVLAREDRGDAETVWRIRPRGRRDARA